MNRKIIENIKTIKQKIPLILNYSEFIQMITRKMKN